MYIYAKRPTGRCSIDTNEVAMVGLMTADEYLGYILMVLVCLQPCGVNKTATALS